MPLAVEAIQDLGLFSRSWPAGGRLSAVAPSAGEAFCLVDGEPADAIRRERVSCGGREFDYELPAGAFWQLHRAAPAVLAQAVVEAATAAGVGPAAADTGLDGLRVWDLYAGAGLLTLPLAAAGAQVTAVEGDRRAVAALRANARRADLKLGGAHGAEVAAALRRGIGGGRPDVVVLDPPRAGAGLEVVRLLVEASPRRIVYVACEPAALARDLAALRATGWEVTALEGFDLFPGTHHVEVVAILDRDGG
jgi:tRNA/tmRNA/rRNA uracil-C5-methylase (TrmA/RlmC/RlmD family)